MTTRKTYVIIAEAIDAARIEAIDDPATRHIICRMACKIADKLALDNPRFDRSRFLKACGFEQ